MPGYVYGGNQPIRPRNGTGGRPKLYVPPFDPSLCGTMDGHKQHRRHEQKQCRKCMDAHNDLRAKQRAAKKAA